MVLFGSGFKLFICGMFPLTSSFGPNSRRLAPELKHLSLDPVPVCLCVYTCQVSDGVMDVIVYPSSTDKTKNRGFAFIEYDSHKSAAMARRKLIPGTRPVSTCTSASAPDSGSVPGCVQQREAEH